MRLAGSFFCLVAVALAGRDDNLAKNGGFEKGLSSWEIVNNSGGLKADVAGKKAKRGKRALHVEKNGRFALDYVGQKIKQVPAGGRISVSLYVRGEGLRNSWIKFHVFDKRGNDLIEDVDLTQLRGSFGWKKIEREFTLPADAASVEIRAAMFLNGELWLDEVEVKTLEKGGKEITEELFTGIGESLGGVVEVVGEVTDGMDDLASTMKSVAEELSNIPQGFKIAGARFAATDPLDGATTVGGQTGPALNLNVTLEGDAATLIESVNAEAAWESTARAGSAGSGGQFA